MDVLANLQKLPAECFTVLLSDPCQLIGIRRGESGYIPLRRFRTEVEARERADSWNAQEGITPAQVEAMEAGSMFGWHVPGANPEMYRAVA